MTTSKKLLYSRHAARITEFLQTMKEWGMIGKYPNLEYEVHRAIRQAQELADKEKEDEVNGDLRRGVVLP